MGEYDDSTFVGWTFWNGILSITNKMQNTIDPATHQIRVWGHAPYAAVTGTTPMPVSNEIEFAMRAYCRVLGLQRLVATNSLFTQWQAQPHATQVTYANLSAELTAAMTEWDRRSKYIARLRVGV